MKIVKAQENDYLILTEITKKSKAHWGYSAEQILEWEEDLTFTKKELNTSTVYKLIVKEEVVGYYSYKRIDRKNVYLANLFLLPKMIGQGMGKYLFDDFIQKITSEGYTNVLLDSDPNAEGFYEYLGFKTIGKKESSIPGRYLPEMYLSLST